MMKTSDGKRLQQIFRIQIASGALMTKEQLNI